MPAYYKVDSRRITFREYWNLVPSWKVLIPWVAKVLRLPMQFSSGTGHYDSVREMEIPESEFSSEVREKLQPLLEQCLALGCHSPRFYFTATLRRETQTSFIVLQHRSGTFGVRLMYAASVNVVPPTGTRVAVLLSRLQDGTFFYTSDQKPKFRTAPGVLANPQPGADPARLIESHQQRLAALPMQNPPLPVPSTEALDQVWDAYEKLSIDFGVQRGLYVLMPPAEVAAVQQQAVATQTLTAEGVEHAEVLAELAQLQEKKSGWGSAVLIFVISMLLFVGAGSRQWSWSYALMLVPVLFIHELGHYVAMRSFNYRNLRMFFIPFFGAAVSGRHYNVPGWKKVVVSLMGPLPGIVLGVILGGAGMVLGQPLLLKFALVTLIINGLNLLPVLPLDGGWIFHTLLFSRHHALDAAFRVIAVIALFVGGTLTQNKILAYLAIPMLLGIPAAYRLARIATTLRERGLPPAAPDDQTIPRETALAIIGEVKKSLPKMHTNKMVAQQALQIFETLNARPPGWLATAGLLFLHIASIVLAVVFVFVFIVAQRTDLGAALASTRGPQHELVCTPAVVWPGAPAGQPATAAQITLVATFSSRSLAQAGFDSLSPRLPAAASLRVFGESLLLVLPADQDAARQEWLGELQRLTKEVFVDNASFQAKLTVSCRAPDEALAKELESELEEYFNTLPAMALVPPWQPHDPRPPEQIARDRLARATYLKLQTAKWQGFDDPAIRTLRQKIAAAQKQGDRAAVTTLRQQIKQFTEEAEKRHLDEVRIGTQGPVDPALVDLYIALPPVISQADQAAHQKALLEIAGHMGRFPLANGRTAPADERFSARHGAVSRKGMVLNLTWVSFNHLGEGAPALAEWLCAKGCTKLKYDLHPGMDRDDDEPD